MSWEQRLREMMLAGGAGALAAVGCVDSSGSGAGADSGTDGVDASGLGADADSGADGNVGPVVNFCCNANGDPCCPSLYCDAMVTPQCTEKMACESDGGTWDYTVQACSSLQDSGPDAVTISFCCNGNIDPCCPSLYCDAMVTVECTQKMGCESEGGTWEFGVQGGCARDAGAGDATSDAPEAAPSDSGAHGDGQPD